MDKAALHIEATAFIYRFGSSLNRHVHFHVCAVDAVFEELPLCDWATPEQPLVVDLNQPTVELLLHNLTSHQERAASHVVDCAQVIRCIIEAPVTVAEHAVISPSSNHFTDE